MKLKEKYQEFLNYLKERGYKENSLGEYRRFLFGAMSHSVEDFDLENFRLIDVVKVEQAGLRHGKYGGQRSTVVLRRYLKFLKESGFQVPIDWRDIKIPKVAEKLPDALTEEERELVLNAIPLKNLPGWRTRALFEVLYATGMRISEALALTRDQIPWETKQLKITNGKAPYDEAVIYFTDRSLHWLNKYLKKRKDNHPAVFANERGTGAMKKATARNYVRRNLKEAGKKIGKHIHHHLMRRTFVTDLLEKGADIKATQYLARHRSERTTLQHYAAVNKARAREIHAAIFN
jgi:site-specific recombinase XerD